MKNQGFIIRILTLSEACKEKINLPTEMALWGDFSNFDRLNYDKRIIKLFLIFYYDDLVAGLTFYEKKYFSFLKIGSSPHTNLEVQFAHLFVKKQDSQRANEQLNEIFVENLTKFIKDNNYCYFSLNLPPKYSDIREFKWHGWQINPLYTYILNLNEIRERGLSVFVGKKVRNIIKYAKQRLTVRKINAEQFYSCYEDTYKRQGKKVPHPKSLFKNLIDLENVTTLGAFAGKELTSAIIFCQVDDTSYYITSGIKEKFHNSNGTTLLVYHYLEQVLVGRNIKKIDLFGANTKNVSYFKSCFDPKLELYFRAVYRMI